MANRRAFLRDSAVLLGGAALGRPGVFSGSGCYLVANVPAFEMGLYRDGLLERKYDISVGKPNNPENRKNPETETPLGNYEILSKAQWENQFAGTWMKFKRNPDRKGREQGGWGIHGSPCEELVGYTVSSGCIRMRPAEASELMETIPFRTPLVNEYRIFGMDKKERNPKESLITLRSDIYSVFENPVESLKEWLPVKERFLKTGGLRELFTESERRKDQYYRAVWEMYKKFIKPLPENTANPDVVEKNPEMREYLEKMRENKELKFELSEILI